MQQEIQIESLGELYEAVQTSGLFADSKTFVDTLPKMPLADILAAYQRLQNRADFDLQLFVESYFVLPVDSEAKVKPQPHSVAQHIESLWPLLTRQPDRVGGTLIALPFPYVVPGGRFREIYYWDSYFTMLGLEVSRQYELLENTLNNFAFLIDHVGHIPNGNRTYYVSRSQPPFFALMIDLWSQIKGDDVWTKYLPQLQKEYDFWTRSTDERVVLMPDGSKLNRYWDNNPTPRPEAYKEDIELAQQVPHRPAEEVYRHIRAAAESGWDFSSRWFADGHAMATIHTTDIIPVDLNCLLYFLEKSLAKAYRLSEKENLSYFYENQAMLRQEAIQRYCWDENAGFYFDYDWKVQRQKTTYSLAGVFPLFFNIASSTQAHKIAKVLKDRFLQMGGLLTTLQDTHQQWDAPNGWAPLHWVAYQGLKNYGLNDLASEIKDRWLTNCEQYFDKTGKMMEKYNVLTHDISAQGGEYPNQDGFGWTNGVYLKMKTDVIF
ncbi:MAG: alpha,alpha-trehalase TreA [Runella sp.]